MEPPNFFDLLAKDLLYAILDHIRDDPFAPKFFSQACKSFYALESTHRTALKPRRLDFLPRASRRYPSILHLDLTLCPCVDDFALKALSLAWRSSLRSLDLSRCRLFSHVGLSALALNCTYLVEVDLSNRPDLTDVAAKAIAEAVNLERLRLGRCKGITDMGIGCIAVKCGRLRHVVLRWCIRVTDFGVGLIAIKCKEIRSLDLSYMPLVWCLVNVLLVESDRSVECCGFSMCLFARLIAVHEDYYSAYLMITERCLNHILQLEHLEDLVLEHCLGIEDHGLATLQANCKSLKMLNLSKCQNIGHIGIASLTNGAQNLEKLILSSSLVVTTDLAKCLQSFPRLQLVKLDGCLGVESGLKAIGYSCNSLKELNLSKCVGVTDENVSFLVKTNKNLEKLDITCCRTLTPEFIPNLTNSCLRLTSLRMESCSLISREGFLFIGQCQLLEELDVTDTEIDDIGLCSISRCTKLSSLKLGICLMITDKGLKHIANSCSELKNLDLYRSSRITDEGIIAISLGCPSLTVVNIAYNSNITDSSLAFLSKCQKLRTLEVRGCPHISPQGLSNIVAGCKNLETLDLKKCRKINDAGMIQLAQHSQSLKQVDKAVILLSDRCGTRFKRMEATRLKEFVSSVSSECL
ncbi:F-box/LRR-repeat protein [Vigna angularis]|uniref:F-box/LRR-repeat protein n=1 Tax=Phaseolus angularis TaxID=3914 RepID=A0A8T0K2X9_PHAAN|nr:F-box/LRR-repeat protein [Vigna angularis]